MEECEKEGKEDQHLMTVIRHKHRRVEIEKRSMELHPFWGILAQANLVKNGKYNQDTSQRRRMDIHKGKVDLEIGIFTTSGRHVSEMD